MAKLKSGTRVYGSLQVDGTLLDSSGDAGSSGQVLSSTATGTNWVAAGGGGGGATVKYFFAAGPASNLTLTNTAATVVLNTEVQKSGSGTDDFELSSGIVTIKDAGIYVVSYTIIADISTGSDDRSENEAFLQINSSGELSHSKTVEYNRENPDGASTSSKTILYNATANDTIQIMAKRRVGSATISILADQTVLTLYKVS